VDGTPVSVRRILSDGEKGLIAETPKADDPAFRKVHSLVLGNCRSAAVAACKRLRAQGFNALLLPRHSRVKLNALEKCSGLC